MARVKLPMQLYYAWPNRNLLSYLKRQEHGVDLIVMTPFAEGYSTDELLHDWHKQLESLGSAWPSLYEYEMEMQRKVGPMSIQKPLKERIGSIEEYYTLTSNPEPILDAVVLKCVENWRRVGNLRQRSHAATIDAMKKSTNSGSPFFTRKATVTELELTAQSKLSSTEWLVTYPDVGQWRMCATLGWRGQEGGPTVDDTKQRVLWMFPYTVNVEELSYYQPLISAAQRCGLNPAWIGNDAVDRCITQLFATKGRNDLVLCTDFTAYDQHFGVPLQQVALHVLSELFRGNQALEEVLSFKYIIPLCIKEGVFYTGTHGMASGSGGTNVDETIAHSALQLEAAYRRGSSLNRYSMCLGDDGILSYPGINVEDVVYSYTRHGLEMNVSKQHASVEDAIYLRRWHHRDYAVNGINVGVYPTMRALGRLRYMERFIDPEKWGRKAVAMRQLSIIENCRYHPLFVDFISFCITRDKYRLGLDIPGFIDNLDDEYREAKANDTLYVSYSQEYGDPRPPSEWEVVKILKDLR